MQVVESIKKAREKGVSDDAILSEIRKQNPEKEEFFKKAQERGALSTAILDEIIKQNSPSQEEAVPLAPPKEISTEPIKIEEEPPPLEKQKISGKNSKTGGITLLTQEAQEREEKIRDNFLKRVEAKERGESLEENLFSSPRDPSSYSTNEEMTIGMDKINGGQKLPIIMFIILGILLLGTFILLILNFS
jgi:hypothetical protein